MLIHTIPPAFDSRSRILILGSFPSVKSREASFFYGHVQNRFWKVLASVFESEVPTSVDEKRAFLSANRIALWDVIGACEIEGSADATIRCAVPNDVGMILREAKIETIAVNGKTAMRYYEKYLKDTLGRDAICLPSTSPANASWSLERLTKAWRVIRIGTMTGECE